MSMVLSQIYLDPELKRNVSKHAKETNRTASELAREGLEMVLMGLSKNQLTLLDEATKEMSDQVKQTVNALDESAKDHKRFMKEIARIRARADAEK